MKNQEDKNTINNMPELPTRKPGGLYRNVNISMKTANIMVIVGILVLVFCMIFLVKHNGFTVSFDTNGGSYMESVKVMHGETVPVSQEPVKEGWNFTGWYLDRECTHPWKIEQDIATDSFTLYAGWEKKTDTQ